MPVPEPLLEDARGRYLGLFPSASSYFSAHDFALYQIKITDVRFIGGFGEIYWLSASGLSEGKGDSGMNPLARHEAMICDHMNADHKDALALYAVVFSGIEADGARMIHVDSHGFDLVALRAGNHIHARIDFERPVNNTEEVRAAMVEMARRARQVHA
jgi:heme iron utilization protein